MLLSHSNASTDIKVKSDANKKEECSEKHSSFLLVGMTGFCQGKIFYVKADKMGG